VKSEKKATTCEWWFIKVVVLLIVDRSLSALSVKNAGASSDASGARSKSWYMEMVSSFPLTGKELQMIVKVVMNFFFTFHNIG
jgi:hypothetical protein